jgi:hypothetical protein
MPPEDSSQPPKQNPDGRHEPSGSSSFSSVQGPHRRIDGDDGKRASNQLSAVASPPSGAPAALPAVADGEWVLATPTLGGNHAMSAG